MLREYNSLKKRIYNATLICIVFILWMPILAFASQNRDQKLEKITLQLQWFHQFQFAGYYAALEKGFYEESGLAVTIKDGGYNEKGEAISPEEEVVFDRAQFGTTRSDILLGHSAGLPVVVVANIMQHSPYIFLPDQWLNTQWMNSHNGIRTIKRGCIAVKRDDRQGSKADQTGYNRCIF